MRLIRTVEYNRRSFILIAVAYCGNIACLFLCSVNVHLGRFQLFCNSATKVPDRFLTLLESCLITDILCLQNINVIQVWRSGAGWQPISYTGGGGCEGCWAGLGSHVVGVEVRGMMGGSSPWMWARLQREPGGVHSWGPKERSPGRWEGAKGCLTTPTI